MTIFLNIIQLLAGIGMFLFAMYLIEESLKNLAGRKFKLFLQRITKNKIGAITGGAVVTGVLQSSSMVSLMVLAFVGAGVFTMKNAMAVILGANLGTTLDSWMVATLGFKVDIEVAAYPTIFIGGLLLILLGKRKSIKYFSYFLLGFGLLFIALAFMKTAMESQVKAFDFTQYATMPLIVFLSIGFVITLLVQSSSVTMALTLSALHAGAIGFAPAAAIVLGSETGTTIKILLSGIGGNASKKRVVLGNFLFNVFLTVGAFVFIRPILFLITSLFHIKDPLIGLVTFSTLINFLSILIFIPLLNWFAKFLELFFKDTDASAVAFIGHAKTDEPETAMDLFRRETEYFIHNSMLFNLELFEIDRAPFENNSAFSPLNEKRKFSKKSIEEKYDYMKQWQGELQAFYINIRPKLEEELNSQLNQLISAVRSSMYSIKSLKDIRSNLANLKHSSKDIKYELLVLHKKETNLLYERLNSIFSLTNTAYFELLKSIFDSIQTNYTSTLNNFYKDAQNATLENLDITTAINFNHELFTSNKALLMAVKDFSLNEKQAEEFNELHVYTT